VLKGAIEDLKSFALAFGL